MRDALLFATKYGTVPKEARFAPASIVHKQPQTHGPLAMYLWYANHFILVVARWKPNEFMFWDSLPCHETKLRTALLEQLRVNLGLPSPAAQGSSAVQAPASNDCWYHTISNFRIFLGARCEIAIPALRRSDMIVKYHKASGHVQSTAE
jgi:hypothetical protein